MAVDISSPSAFEREATGKGSVRNLLATVGRIEQARQNRQILDRFIIAKAADPEASDTSIIAGLTEEGPQFESGLQGIFQRISAGLPEGAGTILPQLQAGQVQTSLQREQTGATRALAEQRRAGKVTPPFKKTKEQTQRDADMKFLDAGKGTEAQNIEARDRLKALPTGTLAEIEPGTIDDSFEEFIKVAKSKRIIRKKRILGFSDEVFGEEAFKAGLEEAINEGLKDGIDPASMETAFREWWDRQAEEQKGQKFQEFVPTSEFGKQKIGDILEKAGKKFKITGFDTDGEPLVEEVK